MCDVQYAKAERWRLAYLHIRQYFASSRDRVPFHAGRQLSPIFHRGRARGLRGGVPNFQNLQGREQRRRCKYNATSLFYGCITSVSPGCVPALSLLYLNTLLAPRWELDANVVRLVLGASPEMVEEVEEEEDG